VLALQLTAKGTLARPSVMATMTTLPTSPLFCALIPVRIATCACHAYDMYVRESYMLFVV
jgi:hypothetical protein